MKWGAAFGIAVAMLLVAGPAMADTTVGWIQPPDGSAYPVGTHVNVVGQAAGRGVVGGTGLDLALVLDSSGSMSWGVQGSTGQIFQRNAANALVDALPTDTTSVAVIDFDSSAQTVRVLTPLNPDIDEVKDAINNIDASGGTNIASGIDAASGELTSARHTSGRAQMMVVISDGDPSSGNVVTSSASAMDDGVDAIHSVGIPGHSANTMRSIVYGPDATIGTADDYGIYTDVTDLSELVALFSGTGGNLVGLDHVDLVMPNGTLVSDVATDGLGNFTIPDYVVQLGPNVFNVTAYGDDGTDASAQLTIYGRAGGIIPEPLTMLGLFGGLATLGGYIRKRRNA